MEGLIIKATGSWYKTRTEDGRLIDCRLPGKFRLSDDNQTNPVAVGDRVRISLQDDETGNIEKIRERGSRLLRKATHGKKGVQLIASNVDQVIIVQSLKKPAFKTGFIDRLLVTCEAYAMTPVIIINKTDLKSGKNDAERLLKTEKLYTNLGYTFLNTSIHDPESISRFGSLIEGKISVLTGHSGTGKSSLLNALAPHLRLKTRDVSRASNKGKHTTTFARLIELSDQTYIVDTPGIREFGLVDIEPYEVSLFFPEMRAFRDQCHFYNCTHRHEPSCAVRDAVENGRIDPLRYENYVRITDSVEHDTSAAGR